MAIDFLGTDEYVRSSSGVVFNSMSAACWAKWDTIDGTTRNILGQFAADGAWQVYTNENYPGVGSADDTFAFYLTFSSAGAGAWRIPELVLSTATWYHIAVTHSDMGSTTVDPVMYLNGASQAVTELVTPTGGSMVINMSAGVMAAGANASAGIQFADASIEDARLYTRILSAQEIAVLAGGYRGPLGGEVLWLPMSEVDGATLSSAAAVVFDMSGNGYHGTPQGGCLGAASYAPRMNGWIP